MKVVYESMFASVSSTISQAEKDNRLIRYILMPHHEFRAFIQDLHRENLITLETLDAAKESGEIIHRQVLIREE